MPQAEEEPAEELQPPALPPPEPALEQPLVGPGAEEPPRAVRQPLELAPLQPAVWPPPDQPADEPRWRAAAAGLQLRAFLGVEQPMERRIRWPGPGAAGERSAWAQALPQQAVAPQQRWVREPPVSSPQTRWTAGWRRPVQRQKPRAAARLAEREAQEAWAVAKLDAALPDVCSRESPWRRLRASTHATSRSGASPRARAEWTGSRLALSGYARAHARLHRLRSSWSGFSSP